MEPFSKDLNRVIALAIALHSVALLVALVFVRSASVPTVLAMLLCVIAVEVALAMLVLRRINEGQAEREQLLNRVVDASDAERQRIARDLHDGVVQDLAGVSFTIAGALEQLGPDVDPHSRAALREAAATTRRGIRQLRTLLVDLYPPNLRREGLESAIGDLLARAQSGMITTSCAIDPGVALDEAHEALAFRVTQEAIRNTLRHAQAAHFEVNLSRHDHRVVLTLRDDGIGFDPDADRPDGHFGLQLLRDAAATENANLTIDTGAGAGTTLILEMRQKA